MTGSAFRLQRTNVVLVGSFNVHIIRPDWLFEIGAITKGLEYEIQVNFSQPGFRMNPSTGAGVSWTVKPDRLSIESSSPDGTEWISATRIVENLPWTPLTAIGTNFFFEGSSAELKGVKMGRFFDSVVVDEYSIKSKSFQVGMNIGDSEVVRNVQAIEKADKVEVVVNFHTDVAAQLRDSSIDTHLAIDAAKRAFGEYEERLVEAKKLVALLFEVEIT